MAPADVINAVTALSTLALVVVTVCYTVTTRRMLDEMQRQRGAAHAQSMLLAKMGQIAAWAGFINAAVQDNALKVQALEHMEPSPFTRIQQLAEDLAQLEAQMQRG